ncbi:EAL domain-containing protein [Altericroceibacterium endophyticum]|uniref:EAL domain-containing protein n=1 Tax=Altericroceibacterium endophyticum TaxID=1808508 RepID=A0A6I4T6B0_9SPHN|nr:EAL domain-containing protein [Altericroceibacterium endophyticum]MXO66377.1 EAL domain-containing protein [Altericroceibacterium endophyticum]
MRGAGINFDEKQRLKALLDLGVMDTPPEEQFDGLARLVGAALGVQSAAVSLIDGHRQWFKARIGIDFSETPRDVAFCDHTMAAREVFVVLDAQADPKFKDNPLVTCENGIRFYAGAPLYLDSGECVGTLCVFDPHPRDAITDEQVSLLRDLADVAAERIQARSSRHLNEIAAKLVETTPDAVMAADSNGFIVYWNQAASEMFGHSVDEALGQCMKMLTPPDIRPSVKDILEEIASDPENPLLGQVHQFTGYRADGCTFPMEVSLAEWRISESERGLAAIMRDISDRTELEKDRQSAQQFLDAVVSNLPGMLFVKDLESGKYVFINDMGQQLIGLPEEEIVGKTDHDLFPGLAEGFQALDQAASEQDEPLVYESDFTNQAGDRTQLRTTRVIIDGEDERQYVLGLTENMTVTRQAQADVFRLARYDMLTGLLNRASFSELLHSLVEKGEPFAMLSLDLERFKAVNDQFGHGVGDAVLREVGLRLKRLTGSEEHVARMGGDEFVAILTGQNLRARGERLGRAIAANISRPIEVESISVYIGVAAGIVLYPQDGATTERLRENVDLALYRAKRDHRGICLFDAKMDAEMRDRRRLENALRKAVEANQIELAYQPVISTYQGRVSSVEALARWSHPVRGPIPPDCFIDLAEECGLINKLGEQLLHRACREACDWPANVAVAVNLSPLQFQSGDLLDTVACALKESGLPAQRLQLEVTEGLMIKDVDRTFRQLEELRSLGIAILIDDFGVGYSSLSYFERFPFDKVKLDKSFVDRITTSKTSQAIVQAVAGLGEKLDMAIVAEGIETKAQARLLTEYGCTHLQGYLFSRPLAPQSVRDFVSETKVYAHG